MPAAQPAAGRPLVIRSLVGWRVDGHWCLTARGRDRLIARLTPPARAHGRRAVDGSYFTVWACERDHKLIGGLDGPGREGCLACAMDATQPGRLRALTRPEAYQYICQLEDGTPNSTLFEVYR